MGGEGGGEVFGGILRAFEIACCRSAVGFEMGYPRRYERVMMSNIKLDFNATKLPMFLRATVPIGWLFTHFTSFTKRRTL